MREEIFQEIQDTGFAWLRRERARGAPWLLVCVVTRRRGEPVKARQIGFEFEDLGGFAICGLLRSSLLWRSRSIAPLRKSPFRLPARGQDSALRQIWDAPFLQKLKAGEPLSSSVLVALPTLSGGFASSDLVGD